MTRPTHQFIKGQTILAEGTTGDRTFKILSGEVVVCKENNDAKLVPIAKLGPGEIFGEMYLFDGAGSRTATVIAASTDVVVEVFFHDEMESMIEKLPPQMFSMLKGFSKRLKNTSKQISDLYQDNQITRLPDGTIKHGGTTIKRQF